MSKLKVFYSYDYNKDANRVNDIRSMGLVKDNKPASKEDWEEICRQGDSTIQKWIDDNMSDKDCVVVFIGEDTINRKWVRYEIEKAWNEGKGLLGVYVHNIDDPVTGKSKKGQDPFVKFKMNRDGKKLRSVIKCYDPNPNDAYNCVIENLEIWIDDAMKIREFY